MIIVVGAISTFRDGGGYFKTPDNKRVSFVARPKDTEPSEGVLDVCPDDAADARETWRERLKRYNNRQGNALGFYKAHRLYLTESYSRLGERFGLQNLYILSPGWGLVRSEYFLPDYHISLEKDSPLYTRREGDSFKDFNHLPQKNKEALAFFGTEAQIPLFLSLSESWEGLRIIFYRGDAPRDLPENCVLQLYESQTNHPNWHLEAAEDFAAGRLALAVSRPEIRKTPPKTPPKIAILRKTLSRILQREYGKGRSFTELRAGDLHSLASDGAPTTSRSVSSCCQAMREAMQPGDSIKESPPGGVGVDLTVQYKFPRQS